MAPKFSETGFPSKTAPVSTTPISRRVSSTVHRGRAWENLAEYNGAQWSGTYTHARASASPRTVWVLVIKCITRLVYTESGPRNLQSRLVCRFNRTLFSERNLWHAQWCTIARRYTIHVDEGCSDTDGTFLRYLFSVDRTSQSSNTRI